MDHDQTHDQTLGSGLSRVAGLAALLSRLDVHARSALEEVPTVVFVAWLNGAPGGPFPQDR